MELESVDFFLLSPSPFSFGKYLLKLLLNLILLLLLFNFSVDLNTFLICGILFNYMTFTDLEKSFRTVLGVFFPQ